MHPKTNTHASQISAQLVNLRQHLTGLLTPCYSMRGDQVGTLTKVIERLSRAGQVNLQACQANPLADVLATKRLSQVELPKACQHLMNSCLGLADSLPWYQRPVANHPKFMAGHINAQIIGPEGLAISQELIVGITLMRPNLDYPDHQHEPEEIYLVLSDGRWRQDYGPWQTPGLGGLVYNPSNIMHGMQSQATPLVALWCLPLDKPFGSFS